jgi:hypothetical protein
VFGASGSTHLAFLLQDPRVQFDMEEWIPVLVSPVGGVVFARPELGATSAADNRNKRRKRLVVGSRVLDEAVESKELGCTITIHEQPAAVDATGAARTLGYPLITGHEPLGVP